MCGVIGIWANADVFRDLYQGLLAIQHRGQDSAGIITYDGRFHTKKGNGLVRDIFTAEHAQRLNGPIGIGHTRYPTIGGGRGEDAQPFQVNSPFGIIMAHNGNVINYRRAQEGPLREIPPPAQFRQRRRGHPERLRPGAGRPATSASSRPEHVFKAVEGVFKKVQGAIPSSPTSPSRAWSPSATLTASSPWSSASGTTASSPSYAFASESVSLNIMNFGEIQNVAAGEAVFLDRNRNLHRRTARPLHRTRPACSNGSISPGPIRSSTTSTSTAAGSTSADSWPSEIQKQNLKIDVVVPVPDSARDAAIEIARKLDLKYREALVKNRYIGRTFIMPADGQAPELGPPEAQPDRLRVQGQERPPRRRQHRPGQHLPGDRARWSASAAPGKVYFASYSPPLRHPCVYGIDMQTRTEFVARDADVGRDRQADRRRQGHLPDARQPEKGRPAGEQEAHPISARPASTASTPRATSPRTSSRASRTRGSRSTTASSN